MATSEVVGEASAAQLKDVNYMPPVAQAVPLGIQHVLAMFVGNVGLHQPDEEVHHLPLLRLGLRPDLLLGLPVGGQAPRQSLAFLRPDGKSQVTIEYSYGKPVRVDTVVVSTQHGPDVSQEQIHADIVEHVVKPIIPAELLDDKTRYPRLWQQRGDLSRMVLHNCDVGPAARGGPLVYLTGGQFFAIAINAGDGGGEKHPSLSGIPYDPQRTFHNYARRFDDELEGKLIAFASRWSRWLTHRSATAWRCRTRPIVRSSPVIAARRRSGLTAFENDCKYAQRPRRACSG